jgi:hypothetical protein
MVKQIRKGPDGKYTISGKKFDILVGSRAQVFHKTAYKTSGGLTAGDLVKNTQGRIVSKKKSQTAKKEKRLQKHGWTFKKGQFGAVKMNKSAKGRGTRRRRRR